MNAIQIEQVGKRYWLRHRAPDRRLMEVLHDTGRRLTGLMTGHRIPQMAADEEFWALRDISLNIAAGEVVGLIGRNGAGKSTLLKLISRIMAPTIGRVGVRGRLGCLLEVGSGFHPELTGRENIFLNGAILGMSRQEVRRKFDQIVAFSEVEAFLDTPVKHYSSGMFIRLAFSVAALLDPEILIVDEVLSVGDASFQKKSLAAIQDAVGRGATCLIVSHHLPSLANLCDRVILLEAGRVAADGPPDEIIRTYLTSARREGGEITWTDRAQAPGNDEARLRAARLAQSGNAQPTANFQLAEEILIQVEYERLAAGNQLSGTLLLKDQIGSTVLMSSSTQALGFQSAAMMTQPPGDYRLECRIPANLLNEGRYVVSVRIGHGLNQPVAIADDCLSFDVHDTGEQRGLYAGNWPGVVRPQLSWRNSRLADG